MDELNTWSDEGHQVMTESRAMYKAFSRSLYQSHFEVVND